MVIRHKKNTAYYLAVPMIDSESPASFKTGLSPTDTAYYKDGAGAWSALAITDIFAEIGATGIYEIDLTAAELNHDLAIIKLTAAGAADSLVIFEMDALEIDDIPTTAMRGTDSAALASVCLEARLAELDAANLPTDVSAILAIPTNPALDTVCTGPRLAELDPANLPGVTDSIKTKTDPLPASWNMTDLAAVPAITATAIQALNFIFCLVRNKKITNKTNKEIELYKDNSSTKLAESDLDDNGTLFTQGKFGTPD